MVGIAPAGFTFAIWGVIYLLIGVFAVYQALPAASAPNRADGLIFGEIEWTFVINMVLNALWLPTFQSNTATGFFVS